MTQFTESISGLMPKPQAIRRNATVAILENWIRSWDFRSLPSLSFHQRDRKKGDNIELERLESVSFKRSLQKMCKISTKKDGKQGHSRLKEKKS